MPIKTVLSGGRVPVKVWSDNLEANTVEQLENTARLPFVFRHVAAMPDVHLGKGATVGSVVATKGAICPAAVGVDIGCGMMAVKIAIPKERVLDKLPEIRHSIERSIPVGHNGNSTITDDVRSWVGWDLIHTLTYGGEGLHQRAMSQMASLGGGNHFIEICLDTEGAVWVMLHSGSRNIGKTIAERHIDKAKDVMRKMFIELPDPDLSYFAEQTDDFKNYIKDVDWCQKYAFENRRQMMTRILKDLAFAVNDGNLIGRVMEVNCHHNYLAWENHFGKNVIVTRKGAVRARVGDAGIIPGSMGTKSYIVEGLGNPESFDSCSHGAGRRMSRSEARRTFSVVDLAKQTEGVECRKDDGVLDEIPASYKDIDEVMENQKDLVKIVACLKQVMCVKG